jgi:eukaryotic-like serine/threonine-protein kinase
MLLCSFRFLPGVVAIGAAAILAGCGGSASTPPSNLSPLSQVRHIPPPGAVFSWLQPGLNAAHTAHNGSESTLSRSNVAGLTVAWTFDTGAQIGNPVVTDGDTAFADSGDGYLYAIDVTTGTQKWRFETYYGNAWATSPAIAGSLVYAPCLVSGSSQQEGLCAVNKSTGKLKWSWYQSCSCGPPASVEEGPVISGSTVVFGFARGGSGDPNTVTALDGTSGALLWQAAAGDGGPNGLANSTPAIANGNVYVGGDKGLCSYQLAGGATNWCSGPADSGTAPAYANGTVYVNTVGHGIYAYDASGGSQLWQYNSSAGNGSGYDDPPAIAGGMVYFSGIDSGYLFALKAKTGKFVFNTSGDGSGAETNSSPSVANGVVYVACATGLCAYNSSTGQLLVATGTADSSLGSPAIASAKVYTVCGYNDVCMYDLP